MLWMQDLVLLHVRELDLKADTFALSLELTGLITQDSVPKRSLVLPQSILQ